MPEKRITAEQKRVVLERAKGCCEYCRSQMRFAVQPFSIEHIVPRSRTGKTDLDNLALACQGCNNHKYTIIDGRDPLTGDIAPIYHPRYEQWSDHFAWNEDWTLTLHSHPFKAQITRIEIKQRLNNYARISNRALKGPKFNLPRHTILSKIKDKSRWRLRLFKSWHDACG